MNHQHQPSEFGSINNGPQFQNQHQNHQQTAQTNSGGGKVNESSSPANLPLNSQYQSTYQSFADIADPVQNPQLFIHVASGQKISRPWQAFIADLDDFFERIYRFYRKSGFLCIVVEEILQLVEILLVVSFTFFFLHCIDYEILFKRKNPAGKIPNNGEPIKITIPDCLKPWNDVRLNWFEVLLLIFAAAFWFTKFGIAVYSIISNYAIRSFFVEALQIYDPSLYTWQEVQTRLVRAQSHCLLRETHLDELAIHNRLLRRVNYMIALVNKGVLPIYYRVPMLGEWIYLTAGMEFNFNLLLFRGVLSLFDKNWKLRDEVKSPAERQDCARRFANRCLAVALINILLFPLIMIWQLLYAFYTYVEAMKRDPTMFSARTWSRYGRWFCRHFNELEHELEERLNRAHRPATRYMNLFTAPLLAIVARFIRFIAATLLSVIFVLTVYDEDVITVEHVITIATGLGGAIALATAFLPDGPEPNRWSFAELDTAILQHIHYRPHNYPPHTIQARNAMANIFVYKSTTILEELISPLVTPYILIRHLRPRSLEIVDFFRVYTLELGDIGDVCAFSQFNFHQNGHRIFRAEKPGGSARSDQQPPASEKTNTAEVLSDDRNTTRNGKMELSLINFKLKNPDWQPQDPGQIQFIDRFTRQSTQLEFDPEVPNLILPGLGTDNQMGDSKSTVNLQSPTTSMMMPAPPLEQSSSNIRGNVNAASQMSDSNFGFGEKRRQLMQLRYGSAQEERDNQMALSSLYFHQIVSDSLLPGSTAQIPGSDGRAGTSRGSRGISSSTFGPSMGARNDRRMRESIPLLRRTNQPINDDEDDDQFAP